MRSINRRHASVPMSTGLERHRDPLWAPERGRGELPTPRMRSARNDCASRETLKNSNGDGSRSEFFFSGSLTRALNRYTHRVQAETPLEHPSGNFHFWGSKRLPVRDIKTERPHMRSINRRHASASMSTGRERHRDPRCAPERGRGELPTPKMCST